MEKLYCVHSEWDDEAQVWVASSEAVPGLATEVATIEELVTKLKSLIPELLAANAVPHQLPVAFELLTRRFELAA